MYIQGTLWAHEQELSALLGQWSEKTLDREVTLAGT